MEIKRGGTQPSGKGPPDWFTGTVRVDPLFQAPDPAAVITEGRAAAGPPGYSVVNFPIADNSEVDPH